MYIKYDLPALVCEQMPSICCVMKCIDVTDIYNRHIDSKCEKIVRRWSTLEESIEIAVFKKWFLWENFLIFMISKQSFLRRNDSIVILLYSVSHFDITSSIISAIMILSWEVVYMARKSSVVFGLVLNRSWSKFMRECGAVAGTMRGDALIISNNILRLGQQVLLEL